MKKNYLSPECIVKDDFLDAQKVLCTSVSADDFESINDYEW